jgi:hypothetical protein
VGGATLSVYDAAGQRLATLPLARLPEPPKATLKRMLSAERATGLAQRPELTVVKRADGAIDHGT